LHGSAYRGFTPVTQMLLARGAELDVPNSLGWTPLSVADGAFYAGIFKQQPKVAEVLRAEYTKRGLPVPAKSDATADASAKAEAANGTGGGLGTVGLIVQGQNVQPEKDKAPAAGNGGAANKK